MEQLAQVFLAGGAIVAVLLAYPYVATAISYRRSDNGLAYILLVLGIAVWNGMFAAQLLDPDLLVKGFFFALSAVGASLAALGWFLFAATASSTRRIPRQSLVYGVAAVLVGIDIAFIVTAPVHDVYWAVPADGQTASVLAVIVPAIGYWLHTLLVVALFAAGAALFARAWQDGVAVQFTRAYTVVAVVTVFAVAASNVVLTGGTTIAPLVAAGLATVGWVQADDGRTVHRLRPYVRSARLTK